MAQSVLFQACLILAPLAVHIRQWKPASLFAVAALVYAVFGGISFFSTQILLSNFHEPESHFHDTYYVVNQGYFTFTISLVMAFFAALTWLQTRLGAMRFPGATKLLFWPFHLGLIGANSFSVILPLFVPRPRRYIDYPEYMETFNRVSTWALLASTIACLILIGLLIWSTILRWKTVQQS